MLLNITFWISIIYIVIILICSLIALLTEEKPSGRLAYFIKSVLSVIVIYTLYILNNLRI